MLCLEGSHDAVTHTYLPDPQKQVVEHDFSRGPYWPAKTYDAVWCVEFLEHVSGFMVAGSGVAFTFHLTTMIASCCRLVATSNTTILRLFERLHSFL